MVVHCKSWWKYFTLLKNDWERIHMQTSWKLENCTAPNKPAAVSLEPAIVLKTLPPTTSDAASSGATVVTNLYQVVIIKQYWSQLVSQDKPGNSAAQGTAGAFLILISRNMTKKVASSPGPPNFSMLHAEKREGLGDNVTCVTFQVDVWLSCVGTCGIDNRNWIDRLEGRSDRGVSCRS